MADEQVDQPDPRRFVLAWPSPFAGRARQLVHLVGYALAVNSSGAERRLALSPDPQDHPRCG
jgi:hypothetical protein